MKYLDYACTFTLPNRCSRDIEHGNSTSHWCGTRYPDFVDSCLDVQPAAARNGYGVSGLKVFCVGANLAGLAIEVARFKMFGPFALVQGIPILGVTIFSIAPK
jgi:hypothetical protein